MMGCVGYSVQLLGSRVGVPMRGMMVVWIVIAVALETIFSYQRMIHNEDTNPIVYRVAELAVIALIIRVMIYLVNVPLVSWFDPVMLDTYLLKFGGDASPLLWQFFFIVFASVVVWILVTSYLQDMEQMRSQEADLNIDQPAMLENDRYSAYQRMMERLILVGLGIVLIAGFVRADLKLTENGVVPESGRLVLVTVLYFFLALATMSQTRFDLLRGGWMLRSTSISPLLAKRWFRYTLIFFAIIGMIAFLLPTNYTSGFLRIMAIILGYVIQIVMFILSLLVLPFAWILSLFSGKKVEPPTFDQVEQIVPPQVPVTAGAAPAWLEVVRAVAGTTLTIGVIAYLVKVYILQKAGILGAVNNFKLLKWAGGVLKSVWTWLRGASGEVGKVLSAGVLSRLAPRKKESILTGLRDRIEFRNLSTREQVVQLYLLLLQRGQKAGIAREPYQTPYQYARQVERELPDLEPDLEDLTGRFLEARYSRHSVEKDQVGVFRRLWGKVTGGFRSFERKQH